MMRVLCCVLLCVQKHRQPMLCKGGIENNEELNVYTYHKKKTTVAQ